MQDVSNQMHVLHEQELIQTKMLHEQELIQTKMH